MRRLVIGSAALLFACAHKTASKVADAYDTPAVTQANILPPGPYPQTGLGWFAWFKAKYPDWYETSSRDDVNPWPWPSGFNPQSDPVFAHNFLVLANFTPQQVLHVLQQANTWTSYYPNSGMAHTTDATGNTTDVTELTLGLQYDWTTFSLLQHSHVAEVVDDPQQSVLAWTGGNLGTTFYHRWILTAVDNGTLVTTEECQTGLTPGIDAFLMNPSLHASHQLWLTQLQKWINLPQSQNQ